MSLVLLILALIGYCIWSKVENIQIKNRRRQVEKQRKVEELRWAEQRKCNKINV